MSPEPMTMPQRIMAPAGQRLIRGLRGAYSTELGIGLYHDTHFLYVDTLLTYALISDDDMHCRNHIDRET